MPEQPVPREATLGRSILVVDDDPGVRETVSELLALEGYAVRSASDGAQALHLIDEEAPAVVLLDMRMPILDGWAFAEELRARALPVPVIVMTAAADARRWAEEIGAAGTLSKPFDVDELLRVAGRYATPTG